MSDLALRLKHLTSAREGVAPVASPYLKVQVGGLARSLKITNLEAGGGNNLEISFNSGRDFYPILPQAEYSSSVLVHFFVLRGVGGAVAWSAVAEVG